MRAVSAMRFLMHSSARRAFSLVEMLLAVFILGIGVISIAALFPVGIVMQRQATDDVLGPVVAKNAFATLRSKLSQSDFGGFNDFGLAPQFLAPGVVAGTIVPIGGTAIPHLNGDWCWMRPSFLFGAQAGTIDVFSAAATRMNQGPTAGSGSPAVGVPATEIIEGLQFGASPDRFLFGIPYNIQKYPLFTLAGAPPTDPLLQQLIEPAITFTQAERSFPQGNPNYGATSQYPLAATYYWDCMFRRNGGKVQVAVFVYRVAAPGGENRPYKVSAYDVTTGAAGLPAGSFNGNPQVPPFPALYLAPNFGTGTSQVSWPNRNTAVLSPALIAQGYISPPIPEDIPNTGMKAPNTFGEPGQVWDDWQAPGSWWVDNHATVHKVLNGRVLDTDGIVPAIASSSVEGPVRLARPIPIVPRSPVNGVSPTLALPVAPVQANAANGFISGIWFIPRRDRLGNVITPVFASVEEL
jgi:hypothetical protein